MELQKDANENIDINEPHAVEDTPEFPGPDHSALEVVRDVSELHFGHHLREEVESDDHQKDRDTLSCRREEVRVCGLLHPLHRRIDEVV